MVTDLTLLEGISWPFVPRCQEGSFPVLEKILPIGHSMRYSGLRFNNQRSLDIYFLVMGQESILYYCIFPYLLLLLLSRQSYTITVIDCIQNDIFHQLLPSHLVIIFTGVSITYLVIDINNNRVKLAKKSNITDSIIKVIGRIQPRTSIRCSPIYPTQIILLSVFCTNLYCFQENYILALFIRHSG